MPRRATFFFSETTGYGWSENFWINDTADAATIRNALDVFISQRTKLLVQSARLIWVRVTSIKARDPYVFPASNFTSPNGQIIGTVDNSADCLTLRMEALNIGYNRVFLRGIPDDAISGDLWLQDPTTVAAVNLIVSYLTSGFSNNIFVCAATVDNPQTSNVIATLTPLTTRGYSFIATHGTFAKNDRIVVSGASVFGYNGRKTVVNVIAGTTTDTVWVGGAKPTAPNPDGGNTTARKLVLTAGPITRAFIEGASRRNPGRFFGLRRGRRRTVLSLRQ